MPGGDRTGPAGSGPMTGRRMGICATGESSDFRNFSGSGRGFGRGFFGGRGRGFFGAGFRRGFGNVGNWGNPEPSDKSSIENEINVLKNQLLSLEKKLSETEK